MKKLHFTKMQGAGNDFVVLDGVGAPLPDVANLAVQLCDRNFGVGADQLLVLLPSDTADFRMLIYDALGPAFHTIKIPHDDSCTLCGDKPTITTIS